MVNRGYYNNSIYNKSSNRVTLTVVVMLGDTDLIAGNIMPSVNIFGVVGNAPVKICNWVFVY